MKFFKTIRSMRQALMRTIFIFICWPAAAIAGMQIDKSVAIDHVFFIKLIGLLIASILGGISSTFVSTSFDDGIKHPKMFKILVGACLGTFSGMMALDNSSLGIFSIVLPVFIVATLGAPIMVFYLMWLSNPETQAEIKEQITQKVREKIGAGK